ncbi:restriction endonuclease subunit S [Agrobacterium tumefaciens]|uniref:restriction endonuclease subunit S n=1 Tax=Agrobacterium tumefaciens TaxID=358 RepID=UPI00157390B9|nr:restriction endonuclease subunit S [Agrobacterium tumefaciens]NTE33333.1 restriction endonuclease subunit S [Agrobacterium tumefaciens]NTE48843.1 restriction endonuclease subunit S [Agrobacterium tumefaciens]
MTEIMLAHAPSHWSRKRLGQLFRERREKVSDKDFPALSVTKLGILPQLETAAKTDDGDNRKGVRAGDFVINSRSDRKGSGGLSDRDGSVSLINIVLRPHDIEPSFAHHLLRSPAFQEEFYRWGHGIVADLWTTRYNEMKNILLAVPDHDTQKAIADFLDRETDRIDHLIERKQQLSKLLDERVACLADKIAGQLEEYSVVPLRRVLLKIEQGWSPDCEARQVEDREWGVLKVGCVNGWSFKSSEHKTLPQTLAPRPDLEIRNGDVLMSRANTRELVGSVAVVKDAPRRLMLCDKLYRLHFNKQKIMAQYAVIALRSNNARRHYEERSNGASASMQNIGQETVKTLRISLPDVPRQLEIANEFNEAAERAAAAKAVVQKSVGRLTEFRASLITAAVTGQIDVTTWGKRGHTDRRLDQIEEAMRA